MSADKPRKKNSGKKRASGGKRKKVEQPDPTKVGGIRLPFYLCQNCQLGIEPRLVWHMETCGLNNEDVYITHTCGCLPVDSFCTGRYDIVPMGVAYLFGFDLTHVTRTGDDGWVYDAPVKQWPIKHHHPDLAAFRRDLEHVNNVPDFIRMCGFRYEEPPSSSA